MYRQRTCLLVVLEWMLLLLLLLASCGISCSAFQLLVPPSLTAKQKISKNRNAHSSACYSSNYNPNDDSEAIEALRSLTDFHEGRWKGSARSFTVTADVAAGVVQRKSSPDYISSIKFGVDTSKRDFTLTETMEWGDDEDSKITSRKLSLGQSNMDVDAVDASYSLDATLPDFPSEIAGTDKLCQFMIEHCIATSNDHRARCFAFYGVDQNLIRVVVCEEERLEAGDDTTTRSKRSSSSNADQSSATLSAQDLIEMQGDIDRLVDKITGGGSLSDDGAAAPVSSSPSSPVERLEQAMARKEEEEEDSNLLTPHTVSLLELSSGVWLGDSIIRDLPMIPVSPLQRGNSGKGFGGNTKDRVSGNNQKEHVPFASWSVGVQKVARRWMWNFGEEIRQVNDFGKSMGAEMAEALTKDLSGSVCVNEGLSRRIPPGERMVYVDWNEDNVGFLIGSHSIQLPRYLHFDRTRQLRPFCTEFCVYQNAENPPEGDQQLGNDKLEAGITLPDVVCSKIERVYNYEGSLKQGCTSFCNLQRFGAEGES